MPVAFASDVVGAVPTSSPHSSTPDFPEEDPAKEALDKWIDAWDAYAAANGYAPLLQGRDPPSVIQFTERDLSLIPALPPEAGASAIAAREALRAQVIHDNTIKRAQREDTLRDHRHRFALLLILHLRPHAGLRLQRLLSSHIVSGTVGASDALYDGIKMYLELRDLRAVRMTKPQRDAVRRALADLEASPLADGCSVQAFSSRVNVFTRDINPFLDRPYAGTALSEFIVEQMPPGLLQAGIALMRELTRAGALGNVDEVIRECKTLVAAHEAPARRAAAAPAPLAMVTAKEMKRLLAADDAAALQAAVGSRPLAPEALAVLSKRPSSKKPGGSSSGPRTTSDRTGRLPDGGRCADGTCQFRHDGPCFRHPKTTAVPDFAADFNAAEAAATRALPTDFHEPMPALIDPTIDPAHWRPGCGAEPAADIAGDAETALPETAARGAHIPDPDTWRGRTRHGSNYNPAACVAGPDGLQPPSGPFLLYLGSGRPRAGDFASCAARYDVATVCVDSRVGGYSHDLADPAVADALRALAASSQCLGVLVSTPCNTVTFSVA